MIKYLILVLIILLLAGCSLQKEINPGAKGFDKANSDPKAIKIAYAVIESMGGRKAWDDLKVVSWNFFGARTLLWNKESGDVRIQFGESDSNIFITNILPIKG